MRLAAGYCLGDEVVCVSMFAGGSALLAGFGSVEEGSPVAGGASVAGCGAVVGCVSIVGAMGVGGDVGVVVFMRLRLFSQMN